MYNKPRGRGGFGSAFPIVRPLRPTNNGTGNPSFNRGQLGKFNRPYHFRGSRHSVPSPSQHSQQQMTAQRQQQAQFQQPLRQQAQKLLNKQQSSDTQPQQNQQSSQEQSIQQQPLKQPPLPPPLMQQNLSIQQQDAAPNDIKVESNSVVFSNSQEGVTEHKDELMTLAKPRPYWMKKDGKINKKERLRRRNQRLRKILQPKNALMVLNELIGSTPYEVNEMPDSSGSATVFKCAVQIEGIEHVGLGKSKPAAKNFAAEAALKHMVLGKLKNSQSLSSGLTVVDSTPEGESDKMEIDTDELGSISWSHVACYALHKLLNSWDEGNIAERLIKMSTHPGTVGNISDLHESIKNFEKKPAKRLPENAAAMNPIMLLNQMQPEAVYEEYSKMGNPPHILFTIKCTVGELSFLGTGSTKKAARKVAAFAACQKVLGIQYSPQFLEEQGYSEDSVTYSPVTPSI